MNSRNLLSRRDKYLLVTDRHVATSIAKQEYYTPSGKSGVMFLHHLALNTGNMLMMWWKSLPVIAGIKDGFIPINR